jgi:lipopolysaccharide/colanic/teichoic acid biosynthesis glycosyltransferase/glycosyltransferase involved in cell wall biosynthesis
MSLRYLILAQLRRVAEEGGEVIGISAPGPEVTLLEAEGIRHVALPSATRGMSLRSDLKAAKELWGVLRREKPLILHTHNPKPGLYGRLVGRACRVPIIVNTVHGLYATPEDPCCKRVVFYTLEAIAARFSDAELVQSREDYSLMTRWRISPPKRTVLLGNGIDLGRFTGAPARERWREEMRAELGVDPGQLVVGAVGRLVAEKGYPELFEAMLSLGERYKLVVVGPEEPYGRGGLTRQQLARAEAQGVLFLGMREDVERVYAAMDILALPSHREGMPRALMEAAAMGVPVVTADVRGCREIVTDGVTGLLVPVGDPVALRGAILRLGGDEALRTRLGQAAQARAREEFDERRLTERVMAVYRALASEIGWGRAGGWGTRQKRPRPAVFPPPLTTPREGVGCSGPSATGGRGDIGGAGLVPVLGSAQSDDAPERVSGGRLARSLKRGVDIVVGCLTLLLCVPVICTTACLVAATMGRPVLFRQQRSGLGGRPFTLLKFRTMRLAPKGAVAPDESRITRLGALLRRTSLDELPEFWNVIKDDMSLVGPRPLLMDYTARYAPWQARRLEVKPGITGLAQVSGRNTLSWEDRFNLDVWYVDHWSLWLDLKILAKTIWNVVTGRGVSAPGHATMPRFGEEQRG